MNLMKFVIFAVLFSISLGLAKADQEISVEAPARPDFVLFVSVKIKPDRVADFKNLVLPYAQETRQEPGNAAYLIHQSPDDPTEFAVYEHWRSDDARNQHMAAAHTVQFFTEAGPMFEPGYPARKRFVGLE